MPEMETNIIIKQGFSKEHVREAARLYAEAFERKFLKLIGPKNVMISLFERGFNPDYALSAMDNQENFMGLAGFHIGSNSLIDLKMKDFIRTFGLIRGVFKGLSAYNVFNRAPQNENQLLMDGIVVDSRYRGHGVGSALFRALEAFAVSKGFHSIKLDVIDENPRAKKLYSGIGFVEKKHTGVPRIFQSLVGVSGYTTMVKQLVKAID